MIEMPEAISLAKQLTETVKGKKIKQVTVNYSAHKFVWYSGEPEEYPAKLEGKTMGGAVSYGGLVEIEVEDVRLLFGDGVNLKYHTKDDKRPAKHQLLLEFTDGTALSCSVQMYGGLWCFKEGEHESAFYDIAREKPSPMTDKFDRAYFNKLISAPDVQKLSAKAFLATEQRIPGLGNGVLQDILFNARIHPKRTVNLFSDDDKTHLYDSVKSTLKEMTDRGGRDTTKKLNGEPGGYQTKMGVNTVGKLCPVCGGVVIKQAYMGGSVYFCGSCQKLG